MEQKYSTVIAAIINIFVSIPAFPAIVDKDRWDKKKTTRFNYSSRKIHGKGDYIYIYTHALTDDAHTGKADCESISGRQESDWRAVASRESSRINASDYPADAPPE